MQNLGRGRNALQSVLKRAFGGKEDRAILIPAMVGRRSATGEKEFSVPGHPDFIWVRLRGQKSETVRAFNETVGLSYGTPVLITRDAIDPRYYRVVRRDTGKYQDWTNVDGGIFIVKPHGHQHSFGDPASSGNDPVFVYKRQLVQPLLARPQDTPDMTVYVEADFYFYANQFLYFAGGSSADMTAYIPGAGLGRYVTIYFAPSTGTVEFVVGTTFLLLFPDPVSFIPEPLPSQGIPLAAVLLTADTSAINWANLFDLRIMLYNGYGGLPGPHGLDPSHGFHTGQLDAADVLVADPHGVFTGTDLETVLYELYLASASAAGALRIWFGA